MPSSSVHRLIGIKSDTLPSRVISVARSSSLNHLTQRDLIMTRFTAQAAEAMRKAISEAGGIEVFAIGRLNSEKLVDQIEIHCRGNTHSVPALLSRPRVGEVVIHNHPNGVLQASQADMMLANLYGEDGVVVIVNNQVDKALWVVEPYCKALKPVNLDEVKDIFLERLPKVMPGYEARTGQVDMSLNRSGIK